MASVAGKRAGGGGAGGGSASTTAAVEVVLLPNLKSCLLNLPASLVSLLLNANTLAQNVIVELRFRTADGKGKPGQAAGPEQSVFMGWTGMQSQVRLSPLVGRDGVRSGNQEKETQTVEIDATFARRLGLAEGTKVGDSPLTHLREPSCLGADI
jgi:peroxin-1